MTLDRRPHFRSTGSPSVYANINRLKAEKVGSTPTDALEDVGGGDLVFDVFGGDIAKRSAGLIRAGGTLGTIAGPTEGRPADGAAVDFVVVSYRAQLSEIVRRVRDGRLRTNIGKVSTLDDAVAAQPDQADQGQADHGEDDHPRFVRRDTRPSMHAAGAVGIGRLRSISPVSGNLETTHGPWH